MPLAVHKDGLSHTLLTFKEKVLAHIRYFLRLVAPNRKERPSLQKWILRCALPFTAQLAPKKDVSSDTSQTATHIEHPPAKKAKARRQPCDSKEGIWISLPSMESLPQPLTWVPRWTPQQAPPRINESLVLFPHIRVREAN